MTNSTNSNDNHHSISPIEKEAVTHLDPLHQSTNSTFLFPQKAAAYLAEQKKRRYDKLPESVEEVELRLRKLASIMGLLSTNDETSSAA